MTFFSENKDFNQLINSSNFCVEYDVLSSLRHEGLKQDDYIEICITDNGTGFEDKDLNNILKPYFTTKKKREWFRFTNS